MRRFHQIMFSRYRANVFFLHSLAAFTVVETELSSVKQTVMQSIQNAQLDDRAKALLKDVNFVLLMVLDSSAFSASSARIVYNMLWYAC